MTQNSLEIITQITVELHHGNTPFQKLGTGVIYTNKTLSGQVYVLTSKHCLRHFAEGEPVSLRVYNPRTGGYDYVVPRNQQVIQSKTEDAAVIIFNKRELFDINSELPSIYIVDHNVVLGEAVSKGFPYASIDQESEIGESSLAAINMRFLQDTHVEHFFQLSTTEDYNEDTISGMSGSGIFIEACEELYLTGIFTRFSGDNKGKVIWSQRITPFNDLLAYEFKKKMPSSFLGHHGIGHRTFEDNVSQSVSNLGPRYCQRVNVKTGTAKYFDCLAKTPSYYDSLIKEIDGWLTEKSYRRRENSENIGGIEMALNSLRSDFATALRELDMRVDSTINFEELFKRVELLKDETERTRSKLYTQLTQSKNDNTLIKEVEADESRLLEISVDIRNFTEAYSDLKIEIANNPFLVISGEAGCGKSHLLGDVATHRIYDGLPTLLFLGTDFIGASYESVIVSKTSFNGSFNELLSSLNEIGLQIGSRVLILIDALNEGRDARLWKGKLSGLIKTIEKYPAIGLAVSVRDTYFDDVIPSGIEDNLRVAVIKHTGFKGLEYEAVQQFCTAYELNLPNVPILNPEFCNPLFLKIFCDTLEESGEKNFPKGFNGSSEIFSQYYKTLDRQFANMSSDYKYKAIVTDSIGILALPIYDAKYELLKIQDAESLLLDKFPSCKNLLVDLIDNNVLLKTKSPYHEDNEDYVVFSYQRACDYLIAKEIVKQYNDWELFTKSIYTDSRLHSMFVDPIWYSKGVLEALAILIPEKYGRELTDIIKFIHRNKLKYSYSYILDLVSEAEINSLGWRSIDTIDRKAIRRFLNSSYCHIRPDDWYYKLAELSTIANHPFNADYFNALMMGLTMKERDSDFQFFFNGCSGYDDNKCALPLRRLIDWAWSEDISKIADEESARLASIMLCWLLSSTYIRRRDEATKALVNLLSEKVNVLIKTMKTFEPVDDMYISERIYAVAYGVALRTSSNEGLTELSKYVYCRIFKHNNPPKDILIRDYARNIVEYAYYKAGLSDVNMRKVRPPYFSDLPEWPDDAAVEYLHKNYDDPDYKKELVVEHNMIWESIKGGLADFWNKLALPEIEDFCPISIKEEKEYNKAERLFKGDMKICARRFAESKARDYFNSTEQIANNGISDSLKLLIYETIEKMLSSEQLEVINKVMIPYHIKQLSFSKIHFNRFPAEGVRNWIVKRAYELGYDAELHGRYDSFAKEWTFRDSENRIDRIGKKYQWIAFREVMGILSDNYKYEDRYANNGQGAYEVFHGSWQSYLRDINPSMIARIAATTSHGMEEPLEPEMTKWYNEETYDNWNYPDSEIAWASMINDLPDPKSLIQKTDDNGTEWLALNNSRDWDEPKEIGKEKYQHNLLKHDVSLFADAIIVHREDKTKAVSNLSNRELWDGIEFPDDSWQYLVNREKYWSPAYKDVYRGYEEWINNSSWLNVPFFFSCEKACGHIEGDRSGTIERYSIPCKCLFEGLGMEYSSKDGQYVDKNNNIIAITYGYNQILVKKDSLINYLNQQNLDIIWIIRGEKRAYVSGGMGCVCWYCPCGVYSLNDENNLEGELKTYKRV